MYNVYKDGGYGLDLVQDVSPNNGIKIHKLMPKHALILRPVYSLVNEMKFWVVSNPLLRTNAPKNRMYEANQNPKYECYKYTKGFIGVIVANVANYMEIIKILDRIWADLEYRVQNYLPNLGYFTQVILQAFIHMFYTIPFLYKFLIVVHVDVNSITRIYIHLTSMLLFSVV